MSQPQSQESLDDEWERSEEALRKLQINSPSPPLPSSIPYPVVQKSGNPGGQIYDDRTPVPVPVPVPRPVQQHGNTSSGQIYEEPQHQPVRSSPDEYIDSALTDTVQNPQERMNLLKFENKILHFVKSRETVLQVPPMSNSFHRLLVYRIAQRFRLEHIYADLNPPADNSSQAFSLVKTPSTRIPTPLLIDIPLKEEVSNVQSTGNIPIGIDNPKSKGEKKPVLMKRDTNKNKRQQKKRTDANKESTSDREKAYAEARARIFAGLEEDGSKSSPEPNSTSTTVTTEQPSTTGSRNSAAVIDTSEKKVTYRDRQAEMYDPDFVRRGSQAPLSAPGFQNSGMSEQSYRHDQQQYRQHQQPYQQHIPNDHNYPMNHHGDLNFNRNSGQYQDNSHGYNMYNSGLNMQQGSGGGYMPTSSQQGYNQHDQFRGGNSGLSMPPPAPLNVPGGAHVPMSNMRGLYSTSPAPMTTPTFDSGRQQEASSGGGAGQEPFSMQDFPKLS